MTKVTIHTTKPLALHKLILVLSTTKWLTINRRAKRCNIKESEQVDHLEPLTITPKMLLVNQELQKMNVTISALQLKVKRSPAIATSV